MPPPLPAICAARARPGALAACERAAVLDELFDERTHLAERPFASSGVK